MVTRTAAVILEQRHLRGEDLYLGPECRHLLGPDLVLESCKIVLKRKTWRSLQFDKARLEGCTIHTKTPLVSFPWRAVELLNCVFVGDFPGDDFGRYTATWGDYGCLERADFRRADVANVRFFGTDLDKLELPGWPFFTIRHPAAARDLLLRTSWPGRLREWSESIASSPPVTTGCVLHAERLGARFGASADEIRETLLTLGPAVDIR